VHSVGLQGDNTVIHLGEDQLHLNGMTLFLDKKMSWQAVLSRVLAVRLLHNMASYRYNSVLEITFVLGTIRSLEHSFPGVPGTVRSLDHSFPRSNITHGFGNVNDKSLRLLEFRSSANLAVIGSWFKRKHVYTRYSWLSNTGRTA